MPGAKCSQNRGREGRQFRTDCKGQPAASWSRASATGRRPVLHASSQRPTNRTLRIILPVHTLTILTMTTPPLSLVEIAAHRGASHDAPENTVASFKLGWEQGADACELDIGLTKDGSIVAIHDETTGRTAGVDRNVAEQTLAELRALDAGSWKGARWTGEKIPTLAEALATMPDGKRMLIEIKCGPEVLPELERAIRASGKKDAQLAIIGFGYETMEQAKARFPQLAASWIAEPERESGGTLPPVAELIAKAKAAKLDGLDLSSHFAMDATFVSQVKSAGLKLLVWTVDDPVLAKKLTALGVDTITTNRPGWLRAQLVAGR